MRVEGGPTVLFRFNAWLVVDWDCIGGAFRFEPILGVDGDLESVLLDLSVFQFEDRFVRSIVEGEEIDVWCCN